MTPARRRWLQRIAVGLVALLLLAGWALYRGSRSGLPRRHGDAVLAGLSADVTVRFDRWGVPHLRAASSVDLAAAIGYLHANDRMVQLELGRRVASGRLAEVVGDVAAPSDRYFVSMGFRRYARTILDSAGAETRALIEAYARGVNAWLQERGGDLPPELRLLRHRVEPWRPIDSAYFQLQMAHDLSFWQARPEEPRAAWMQALEPSTIAALLGQAGVHVPDELVDPTSPGVARSNPVPDGLASAWQRPLDFQPGSNNWAVTGARSASGRPLVANDPHLRLALPAVWYQVVMHSPDYSAAGMSLPGLPIVVIGQGPSVAWGFTNVSLDDHDLFFERLSNDGASVERPDGWLRIEYDAEEIRLADGSIERLQVGFTDHGVLLEASEDGRLPARSMAWTGAWPSDAMAVFRRLARAEGVAELRGNLEEYVAPAQNLIAADARGAVLYTAIGRAPRRGRGDGLLPAPGWRDEYRWQGLWRQADNPTLQDPDAGFVATANHDVRVLAAPADGLAFSGEYDTPYRAERIGELLAARTDWTVETLAAMQSDTTSLYARDVIAHIEYDYDGAAGQAWEVLRAWDGDMRGRGGPVLFSLLADELPRAIFADEAAQLGLRSLGRRHHVIAALRGELDARWFDDVTTTQVETKALTIGAALVAAWERAHELRGPTPADWDYAQAHTLTLRNPLGSIPVVGGWLNLEPVGLPGSSTTIAAFAGRWRGATSAVAAGPSMRWIADPADPDASRAIVPAGQSGHPADAHYSDQLALYARGETRAVQWSEPQIEANAASVLVLRPAMPVTR